jgi:hypothetical protein
MISGLAQRRFSCNAPLMTCDTLPSFYRQVGKDPEQLLAETLENLATRFKLQK